MSGNRDAKLQQILEQFQAGDYQVDPAAVAGSVIRRMSLSERTLADATPRHPGQHRIRGIVSVDRGRARLAAF